MKHKNTLAKIMLVATISVTSSAAIAGELGDTIKTVAGSFEEVFADLQDAAINRSLAINYLGDERPAKTMADRYGGSGKDRRLAPARSARSQEFTWQLPTQHITVCSNICLRNLS